MWSTLLLATGLYSAPVQEISKCGDLIDSTNRYTVFSVTATVEDRTRCVETTIIPWYGRNSTQFTLGLWHMEDNVWLESLCKEVVFTIPSGEIEGKMINSSCIYELETVSCEDISVRSGDGVFIGKTYEYGGYKKCRFEDEKVDLELEEGSVDESYQADSIQYFDLYYDLEIAEASTFRM